MYFEALVFLEDWPQGLHSLELRLPMPKVEWPIHPMLVVTTCVCTMAGATSPSTTYHARGVRAVSSRDLACGHDASCVTTMKAQRTILCSRLAVTWRTMRAASCGTAKAHPTDPCTCAQKEVPESYLLGKESEFQQGSACHQGSAWWALELVINWSMPRCDAISKGVCTTADKLQTEALAHASVSSTPTRHSTRRQ
jgi:hypothetical protein